ncbi:unnamed protein product [Soboliphyme baturini]|uniref:Secreted protein n=1 Tax=Soboliphyme baturini TaxID=241478 RepID=A0A183J5Y1_9BILA|nr:unnamed protein product [Soboliphyme baturini]
MGSGCVLIGTFVIFFRSSTVIIVLLRPQLPESLKQVLIADFSRSVSVLQQLAQPLSTVSLGGDERLDSSCCPPAVAVVLDGRNCPPRSGSGLLADTKRNPIHDPSLT